MASIDNQTGNFLQGWFRFVYLCVARNFSIDIRIIMKHEIRLAKIYDTFPESEIKVVFGEEITQEQFEWLKLAKHEIDELKSIQRLYDFVCKNEYDFEELLIDATNFIFGVIQNVERDYGEIFIAYDLKTDLNNKLESYSRMNIPLDAIEYLKKELRRD